MTNLTDNQTELVDHLRNHGLFTDGPYRLSSGRESDWYLVGRQTTFDGAGARIVARCILEVIDPTATRGAGAEPGDTG